MSSLKKLVVALSLMASFAPLAANAGSFFTPHAQLVQKVENTYHTHFRN
jgi:hypothetical protein